MFSRIIEWIIEIIIRLTANSSCWMRKQYNLYCPGCGGTRALIALLRFDIVKSIQYNPMVLILVLYFSAFFAQFVFRKILVSNKLVISIIIMWGIFFVLRNVLLVFWGIDCLGDINL